MKQTVKGRTTPEYKVEHLTPGQDELASLLKVVEQQADLGWELVEACGDEKRSPVLIFEKRPESATRTYKVEHIPTIAGADEITAVNYRLAELNEAGWKPLTVLDSPVTRPIGVFVESAARPAEPRLLVEPVPLGVFEKTEPVLMKELLAQQLKDRRRLITIMHGGLHPVLIFGSAPPEGSDEFLIEYARQGIFKNETRSLIELIVQRQQEGWYVAAAFEDEWLWPCVVLRREMTAEAV